MPINSQPASFIFRSEQSAQYLSEVFRERQVIKKYWSVVIGSPNQEEGEISVPLKEQTVRGRFKITLSDQEMENNVSIKAVMVTLSLSNLFLLNVPAVVCDNKKIVCSEYRLMGFEIYFEYLSKIS